MKLSEFILLSEVQKKQAVVHHAMLIGKRRSGEFFMFLFRFDNFYVETLCDADSRSVLEYRVFRSTIPLAPYRNHLRPEDLIPD